MDRETTPDEQVDVEPTLEDDDGDRSPPGDESDTMYGFGSGYESADPMERFLVIRSLQKRLDGATRRLRQGVVGARKRIPESPAGQVLGTLQNANRALTERRKMVEKRVVDSRRQVVGTLQEQRARVQKQARNQVKAIADRQRRMQEQAAKQVDDLKAQMAPLAAKVRSAKWRQARHMICFNCSMLDVVITAYWLGAFPQTFHLYYTFKCVILISLRAIWYKWMGAHYFLFDLCYYSNLMLMIYLWLLPSTHWVSPMFFQGVFGLSGTLLISIPVFRNSFVPHSLDKITSLQIHISPVLTLWAVRWYTPRSQFAVPDQMSVLPCLGFYAWWAFTYYMHQFVFGRKHIERKGYSTLYQHMAYDMGILKKLPDSLQGPFMGRVVFMVGHFSLFAAGLPYVYFPYFLQTLCICVASSCAFNNGAKFYITYFWKVYDQQIHTFERQLREAQEQAQDAADQSHEQHAAEAEGDSEEPRGAGDAAELDALDAADCEHDMAAGESEDDE